MEEFSKLGIRSIILTSGTLSPLDSFALEINLDFPIRLENPHVISPDQVWVGVVPSGPSGYPFNSSYRSRDSVEYKQELGNAMVNFARIVPDGLLVFFPSYYLMDQCIDCWKNMSHASSSDCNTIWERICKNKQPVIEPKQSALFQHAIEDFETKLHDNSTSGAIFFAVCRGKVSEGLDFADRTGRAVVITGMPFSTKSDPKVRLKREYLDQQALPCQKNSKVLTGEEWYFQQASRAVNQAVGRVIRHRNDYGAIIFCDERFMQQKYQCQMSYWLRPRVKCYPKFGDIVFTLTRFFRDKGKCTSSKPKPSSSLSVDQVGLHQDKSLPSENPTRLNLLAEHFSENPSSSVLSNARGNTYDLLGQIVPANRATLSAKRKYHFASRHSTDQFHFQNSLRTNEIRTKKTQYKDNEVIDLDSDPSHSVQQRPEEVFACYIKKPKILETGYVASDCETDGIVEELHDVDSRHVPQRAHISNGLETIRKLKFPVSVCGDPEFGSTEKVGTQCLNDGSTMMSELGAEKTACEQQPGSKEQFQCTSIPCRNEETKGSAFLMQVQEKLTVEEYRDFVGFMKALKSKTMKIAHVLESIARLFSSPERFSLLKRFKDFVPSQYRPIYEQHILAHCAADGAPCVLPE